MATICKPGVALPENVISQQDLLDVLRVHHAGLDKLELKLRLALNTTVQQRYFVTPLNHLFIHDGIASRVERYISAGIDLAITAIARAIANARLQAADIDLFILTSCTIPGVVLPGLDAYIVNVCDLPYYVRRLPIAQMGCHAGVTALALAHDYLLGQPDKHILVCNLELCSLNEQPGDTEAPAFVSRGLFGDAACAAVVRGDTQQAGLRLLATRQFLVPDTINHMQYRLDELGNHFDTNPDVVRGLKRGMPMLHTFLESQGYRPEDLEFLVSHTGGPRVMDAVIAGLGVDEALIAASRESLRSVGNLSSATVLDVLSRVFDRYRPADRAKGLLLGFGPGTTIEMILVEWQNQ